MEVRERGVDCVDCAAPNLILSRQEGGERREERGQGVRQDIVQRAHIFLFSRTQDQTKHTPDIQPSVALWH